MATITLTLDDNAIAETAKAVLVDLLAKSARGQVLPKPGADALAGKFAMDLEQAMQQEKASVAAAIRAISEASTTEKLDNVAVALFGLGNRPLVEFDTGAEDENGDPIMDTRPMDDVEFAEYLTDKAQAEIPKVYYQLVGAIESTLSGLLTQGTPVAEVLAGSILAVSTGA